MSDRMSDKEFNVAFDCDVGEDNFWILFQEALRARDAEKGWKAQADGLQEAINKSFQKVVDIEKENANLRKIVEMEGWRPIDPALGSGRL